MARLNLKYSLSLAKPCGPRSQGSRRAHAVLYNEISESELGFLCAAGPVAADVVAAVHVELYNETFEFERGEVVSR